MTVQGAPGLQLVQLKPLQKRPEPQEVPAVADSSLGHVTLDPSQVSATSQADLTRLVEGKGVLQGEDLRVPRDRVKLSA
ncbi:MAG: hypothetical protein AAF411_23955, partial [Myxococcota bacterium]